MDRIINWGSENALILMLGIATVFTTFWLLSFKNRLKVNTLILILISILHTFIGVLSVKAFAIIEGFGDLSVVGNMSLFGGVFFMPIAYYLGAHLTKRSVSDIFDIFTVCMVFTLMCARCNCIISGCCMGRLLPHSVVYRWPTRELELLYYIVLMIYLIPRIRGNKSYGTAYPMYMMSYGVFRFITECFRTSDKTAGIWHVSHIWACIAFFMGLSLYVEIGRNTRRSKKERRKAS